MFHFSTDRLAGLDNMILKIAAPPKVPTLIPNHDTYRMPVRKLRKQKPHRETRSPLVDKIDLPPASHPPTSSMLLHSLSAAGDPNLPFPSSPRISCSPDLPAFRPLPPLPSASTLQLPSFLDFSTRSFTSLDDRPSCRSTTSFPTSALFCVPSSPVSSSPNVVVRKTRNKVVEGPQWIPAFHHPNSPYVPWSLPVRRRILPPPSPMQPSPVCPSPCARSGAVAPEPWASSIFSHTQNKGRLSSSWKSFKGSVKKGVKSIVSRLKKSKPSLKPLCIRQDVLSIYNDTDTTAAVQPHSTFNPVRSTLAKIHGRDSLASLISSDSTTLAGWLAERRITASGVIGDAPREMSVGEYELMGSWLDLRHGGGGWVCGIRDCDMHTVDGSPNAAGEHSDALRMAMPFDGADLLRSSPRAAASPFPTGPFSAPPRWHSLPRLPCQIFDMYSAQEAQPGCLGRRELSMPGGWTYN